MTRDPRLQDRPGEIPAAPVRRPADRHGRGRNPRRAGAADRRSARSSSAPRRRCCSRRPGPRRREIVAKTAGSRKRLIAAFDTTEEKIYDEYFKRLANPQQVVEIPSGDAPVHAVQDHRQGRRSHQAAVLSAPRLRRQLLSELGHRLRDRSGDRPAQRRLPPAEPAQPLRDRHQRHRAVRPQAHLHGLRGARREAADHVHQSAPIRSISSPRPCAMPGDELALVATMRGETAAVVKSLTNDILVPADAEMTLEGYLDERGYVEPEGPFGEYMGYYGAIHMDPVFHCTAITMRKDVLHHTLQHGSAFVLDQTDSQNISAIRIEAEAMRILQGRGPRSGRGLSAAHIGRLEHAARLDPAAQRSARRELAIAALFGGISRLKHVFVFDEDIDIRNDKQVEWALGTRFQADQDLVILHGIPGMTDGPLAARPADRRQDRLRLHQAVRPRRRDSADAERRQGVQGPGALPDHRAGAVHGADVLCRPRRGDRQRRRPRNRLRAGRTAAERPARPRPRRPLSSGAVKARRHRHRRRALPRSQLGT